MDTRATPTGPRVTERAAAWIALILVATTLVVSAGWGIRTVALRAQNHDPARQVAELRRLSCIERAVRSLTEQGQAVRVRTDRSTYLEQRVTELIAPRLDITTDTSAPLLSVLTQPTPTGALRCGDVEITLRGAG
jgi:hypothetical protein